MDLVATFKSDPLQIIKHIGDALSFGESVSLFHVVLRKCFAIFKDGCTDASLIMRVICKALFNLFD
jgi:hypothetical protein